MSITINQTKFHKTLREVVVERLDKIMRRKITTKYRVFRRNLVGIVREELANTSHGQPSWAPQLFEGLKSEARSTYRPHGGAGINVLYRAGQINLRFISNDTQYEAGDPKYGWNQYWAIENALHGREEVKAKAGGVLALPDWNNKERGDEGWVKPIFVEKVGPVRIFTLWTDRMMKAIAKRIIKLYG